MHRTKHHNQNQKTAGEKSNMYHSQRFKMPNKQGILKILRTKDKNNRKIEKKYIWTYNSEEHINIALNISKSSN